MVHDPLRNMIYITDGSQVLRYHLGIGGQVSSIQCDANSSLCGIDISRDNNTLVVCDTTTSADYEWFWVVDLRTGGATKRTFARGGYGAGTYSVAFGADNKALVTGRFAGSGWVGLRCYDPAADTTTTIGSVRQDTMVNASVDGGCIGVAEANIVAASPWRYRVSDGNHLAAAAIPWFIYEIGVARNGAQYAVPTYGGLFVFDAAMQQINKIGTYAGESPIGVVYHPTKDLVYLAWAKTPEIRAHNTSDLSVAGVYGAVGNFDHPGNHGFDNGRLRISKDGRFLMATMKDGVGIYALQPAVRLAYNVAPVGVPAGAIIPAVKVMMQDTDGQLATEFSGPVTVVLGANPTSTTLQGTTTVNAVSGVATFSDLKISKPGVNYTLRASTPNFPFVESVPFTIGPAIPTHLSFATQPANTGAGQAISPAVRVAVLDSLGNVAAGATDSITVSISNNAGGGTLAGTCTANAVNGIATFPGLSIENAAAGYTLAADAGGLAGAISLQFNIIPGPVTQIAFQTEPAGTTAGIPLSPAVQVALRDALGNIATNTATGVTLALANNPTGAILAGTLTRTPVDGIATFADLSIARIGAGYTLSASASGTPGAVSRAFDISLGPPAKLAFAVQPSNAVAGGTLAPAVQVVIQDAGGNTAAGATNTVTLDLGANPNGGTLAGTRSVNAAGSAATFGDLSITRAASGYTLAASSAGLASATSGTFNVTPAAAAKLEFAATPSSSGAGQPMTPAVQVAVQDSFGNTVPSAAGSVTVAIGANPAAGTLSGTRTAALVNGVATFADLSIDKLGAGYTLTATSGGLTGASDAFTIVPGPPARLAFSVQPADGVAGQAFSPSIQGQVLDSLGHLVTDASTSILLALGDNQAGGTLSGTLERQAVGGIATFPDISLARAGSGYTLTVSAPGLSGATSTPFAVRPNAPAKLAFAAEPSYARAGQALATQVVVQDAFGNTIPDGAQSITLALGANPAGGSLAGTLSRSAVAGIATFEDLSIDKLGTGYTLAASAEGLAGAASGVFDVGPGPAARLVFQAPLRYYRAGAPISPAVQVGVQDAFGNPVPTGIHHVAVSLNAGAGGTLTGTLDVDTKDGVASFGALTIDKAGTGYVLAAAADGLSSAASSAFDIVVGPPARLSFTAQPSASGSGISAVRVSYLDAGGNAVAAATTPITLALGANPGGATLAGTLTRKPAAGVATFEDLRLDRPGDGYTLVASASGLESVTSAPFSVAATDLPDLQIKQAAEPNTAFASARVYQAAPEGDQVESVTVLYGATAAYTILLRNEGNTSRPFVVRSRESGGDGWSVTYRRDGANIGGALTSSDGYRTESLAPGASITLTLEMAPGAAAVGTSREAVISVLLAGGESVADAVKAAATCPNRAPGTPELLAPGAGAVVSPTPTFRLKVTDPDSDACRLIVELTRGDEHLTLESEQAASGSEMTLNAGRELASGDWTWRAQAADSHGAASDWSGPLTFTADRAPAMPEVLGPPDGNWSTPIVPVVARATDPDGEALTLVVDFRQGDIVKTVRSAASDSGAAAAVRGSAGEALGAGDWSWRVKAVDGHGVESDWSAARTVHVLAEMPDVSRWGGLSMFALPMQTSGVLPQEIGLGGAYLGAWDAAAKRYVLGSDLGKLVPGVGYWLLAGGALTPVFSGPAPSGPVAVPLHRGWNLVGQPFPIPLAWNGTALRVRDGAGEELSLTDASERGWVRDYAWAWKQDASAPDLGACRLVYDPSAAPGAMGTLPPWQGFWIEARQECTLILPLPEGRAAEPAPLRARAAGSGWRIRLRASGTGGGGEVTLGAGAARALCIAPPPDPPAGPCAELGVRLEGDSGPLAMDVRSDAGARQEWAIVVEPHHATGAAEAVTLSWPDLRSVPKGMSLTLVDEAAGTRRSLRTTGGYSFATRGEARRFRLVAEPRTGPAVSLTGLALAAGRGGSQVRFTLSAAALVDLELLAPSGRLAARISQGRSSSAGANVVPWSGQVAPGVYLLRARATTEEGTSVQVVRPVMVVR